MTPPRTGSRRSPICWLEVHNAFRLQTLLEIPQALTVARDSSARHISAAFGLR